MSVPAYIDSFCRGMLAFVFAYSAFAKLRSRRSFREFASWIGSLPVPAARFPRAAAAVMSAAEVVSVAAVAVPSAGLAGFVLAAATLGVFVVGTWLAISRGAAVSCQCFGKSQAPLGRRHLARDAGLLAVALAGAVTSQAHGARPGGLAVSVTAALFAALTVIFLDDMLGVLGVPASPQRPGA